jgi:hypothetical protein
MRASRLVNRVPHFVSEAFWSFGNMVQVGMVEIPKPPDVVRMWVDDERPMPEGWNYHAKHGGMAIAIIELAGAKKVKLEAISLDHDLGCNVGDRDEGYGIACRIERDAYYGLLPRLRWTVHSANPAGAARMEAALRSADRFWDERDGVPHVDER